MSKVNARYHDNIKHFFFYHVIVEDNARQDRETLLLKAMIAEQSQRDTKQDERLKGNTSVLLLFKCHF